MREAKVEKKVCQRAKDRGWMNRKFKSPSNNGGPDRIFFKGGVTVLIEFKHPKVKPVPSPLQKITMEELTHQRIPNACFNDVDKAVAFLDRFDPERS